MYKEMTKPGQSYPAPCPPLADALSLHLDGRSGRLAGPWALGWDYDGLEATGRLPASATTTS